MDQSQSSFSPPKLPPKRKALSNNVDDFENASSEMDENTTDSSIDQADPFADDIPPELLAAYEQEAKNTPSSVTIDITIPPPSERVTAPILEDYIDPFAVPILYLLDEANAVVKKDENEPEDVD